MNQVEIQLLSSELKDLTKEAHQALEAIVVRKIKEIHSPKQYSILLQQFYGYHYPMENLMDKYLDDEVIPGYSKRRRAGQILIDLARQGSSGSSE